MMEPETITLSPAELEKLMHFPRREALSTIVPITIVYSILFLGGAVGNVVTCIVIFANKYMHTSTNYYLFNLAVADLLFLLLGLPQELYILWEGYPYRFGETFCTARGFACETSTCASILTITSFTVERFVAICHPMKIQLTPSLSRVMKIIALIWLTASLCAIPTSYQFGIRCASIENGTGNGTNYTVPDSCICGVIADRRIPYVFTVSTIVFFLFPMTAITVFYVLIGLAVRQSVLARNGSDSSQCSHSNGPESTRTQHQIQARRSVIKMLVAVVVAFFICWAPFHAQRLLAAFTNILRENRLASNALFYISGTLVFVVPTINPLLYNIMSLKFRQAFRRTLSSSCKVNRRRRCTSKSYRFNNTRTLVVGTDCTSSLVDKKRKASLYSCVRGGEDGSSSSSGKARGIVKADDPFDVARIKHVTLRLKNNRAEIQVEENCENENWHRV